MRSYEFYQERLEAVSRSFALCIPQLSSPFREQVALAYLLLRLLDTVEDAPFAGKAAQQAQFDRFCAFLRRPPTQAEVDVFTGSFPAKLTEGERNLLCDTFVLLEDAYELPERARRSIFSAVDRMACGMAVYAQRPSPLRLIDLEDVDRYCCIVAGLVGELLTELWAIGHDQPPAMAFAYQFGLFLQKLNILKDQAEDEAVGRFLVPDRQELLSSLRGDAEGALGYLLALPHGERGYRTFCAWSLMLGADLLSQLNNPGPKQSRRAQTIELLSTTATIAEDNDALSRLFAELMPKLPEVQLRAPLMKPESAERFRDLLAAPLTDAELQRLGIVVPIESPLRGAR
jgi:phytoene/squalene synthetase